MSGLLLEHRAFLDILLDGEEKQALALIQQITPLQVKVITEIFHNLLSLPMDEEESGIIKRHRSLIKNLGNNNKAIGRRRNEIKSKRRRVINILRFFREQLNSVLR